MQNLFEQYLKNEINSSPDVDSIDEEHVIAFKEDFKNFLRKCLLDIDILEKVSFIRDACSSLIPPDVAASIEKRVKLLQSKEVEQGIKY